jgi:predicted SnoaL-like aldol condensation-catalyzing enzyme
VTARRDLISDYFRHQYETKEGTTVENVNGLFSEDLVFHLTGDKAMGRDALVTLCDLMRRLRHGQSTLVTRFEENGDTVSFVLYIVGTDPSTGHEVSVSTRTDYRFLDDKVVEVWQEDPAAVENAVRAAGVRL